MPNSNPFTEIDYALLATKHTSWMPEREYRVFTIQENTGDVRKVELPQTALKNIFLGCRIDESDKQHLIASAKKNWPLAKVYQTQRSKEPYGLCFIEV